MRTQVEGHCGQVSVTESYLLRQHRGGLGRSHLESFSDMIQVSDSG